MLEYFVEPFLLHSLYLRFELCVWLLLVTDFDNTITLLEVEKGAGHIKLKEYD